MKREILINNKNSKLWVIKNYDAKTTLDDLCELKLIEKPPIQVMGKLCHQNRNVGFFSNESTGYHYSRQKMPSQPMTPILSMLMDRVNHDLKTKFNGALVNEYMNGTDYIGAHSDDENGLDSQNNTVVSLSYGATRKFRIRDKLTNKKIMDYPHESGTLLVMEGDFQKHFKHEIAKEMNVKTKRKSITFRKHKKHV